MIFQFPSGPLDTNAYLITEEKSELAFVIDPAFDSFSVIQKHLKDLNLTLVGICLTHSHWDHVGDASLYLDAYPKASLFVHEQDLENLLHPGSDGINLPMAFPPIPRDRISLYETQLSIASTTWEILHTPGHSPGSVCLFDPIRKVLFSGDTLFSGTYGNTIFPTSSKTDMLVSLLMLSTLPDEVQIYPGHGEGSVLKGQKPWMRALSQRYTLKT
jgi:glyoxylase-like metal-dependent hydrolase (beta-lactamase superfamily II)